MGGIPVVEVTRGGVPVTESDRGVPYEIASNGLGLPVCFVARGGIPVCGVGRTALSREVDGTVTVLSLARTWTPHLARLVDGTVTVS